MDKLNPVVVAAASRVMGAGRLLALQAGRVGLGGTAQPRCAASTARLGQMGQRPWRRSSTLPLHTMRVTVAAIVATFDLILACMSQPRGSLPGSLHTPI